MNVKQFAVLTLHPGVGPVSPNRSGCFGLIHPSSRAASCTLQSSPSSAGPLDASHATQPLFLNIQTLIAIYISLCSVLALCFLPPHSHMSCCPRRTPSCSGSDLVLNGPLGWDFFVCLFVRVKVVNTLDSFSIFHYKNLFTFQFLNR